MTIKRKTVQRKAVTRKAVTRKAVQRKAVQRKAVQREAVWEHPAPRAAKHVHLTRVEKNMAKASAKRAGRPYPNLVDNMRAARKKST